MEEINLHINNGGISLSLEENKYEFENVIYKNPILVIESTHFENQTNQMKIQLTPDILKEIGLWMVDESKNAEKYTNHFDVSVKLSRNKK